MRGARCAVRDARCALAFALALGEQDLGRGELTLTRLRRRWLHGGGRLRRRWNLRGTRLLHWLRGSRAARGGGCRLGLLLTLLARALLRVQERADERFAPPWSRCLPARAG